HDLVTKEWFERDAAMPSAGTDDAELEAALGDTIDDGLRVGDREPDAHLRMQFLELAEQQGHPGAARARRRAELQDAGERSLLIGLELFEQMLLECEQALRRGIEAQAGLGWLDGTGRRVG